MGKDLVDSNDVVRTVIDLVSASSASSPKVKAEPVLELIFLFSHARSEEGVDQNQMVLILLNND